MDDLMKLLTDAFTDLGWSCRDKQDYLEQEIPLIEEAYRDAASDLITRLDAAGYAIVPKYPTYEQVMQGLHPAIPGSVTEIYCEMIKAAPKLT